MKKDLIAMMKAQTIGVEVAPLGTVHAFAYIMTGDRPIGVPSLEYVNICARGFLTFRLDMEVLQTAVHEAMASAGAKG